MVYRSANPPAPLVFIQDPSRVHASLSCLLAWRYAQLLTVLPKRETEAQFWRHNAQQLLPTSALTSNMEASFGDLASLKGSGERPAGFFIDNSIRRAIPCLAPLVRQ